MMPVARAGAAVALALALASAAAQEVPEGYRTERYRAPVPDRLEGVTVVDDAAAHALWEAGETVFVDVMPRAPKPENLPEGTIWREKPRRSIPGAIWLPNVGYGRLAEATERYFRRNLAEATGGDRDRPVLFFCLDDCWMSWNAAKRAREDYGYTRVHWYPYGTDGWSFMDWPLEDVPPAPAD
jgi:PQQ-dependent catabolism-associated CXXCW motif protein